jgi:hypothetical protein
MEPTPEPTLNYQLKRYHTVLRDFMAYLHSREHIYPPDHEVCILAIESLSLFDCNHLFFSSLGPRFNSVY